MITHANTASAPFAGAAWGAGPGLNPAGASIAPAGVGLGDSYTRAAQPNLSVAFCGAHLYKRSNSGLQTLRFAYPSNTASQHTGWPSLQVTDALGRDVNCIVHYQVCAMPEAPTRNELRVCFDVARMPPESYFRYGLYTVVGDAALDLSKPVAIPTANDIPPELQRYLREEPNVQVKAPEIQQAAAAIRARSTSLQDLVANTRR